MDQQDFDEFSRQLANFPFRRVRNVILALLPIVLLVVGGFTAVYQVEAEEVGIVLRFGKVHGQPQPPGLHAKLPFGIDTVELVPTARRLSEEFGFRTLKAGVRSVKDRGSAHRQVSLMLTGDLNIADVPWIVQYQIRDPEKFLFRVRNREKNLRDLAESAMRLVVGDYSITDVLKEKRAAIEREVHDKMQEALDLYEAGIQVTTVKLQDVYPPSDQNAALDVKAAFDEVSEAEQEKKTTINEARKEYNREIPEAKGQAHRMVAEAEGYKTKRINEAEGDVARFNALFKKYQQYPEVTRTRLYLETLAEILPEVSQIYIIDESQGGPLQILDLKQAAGALRRPGSLETPADSTSGSVSRSQSRRTMR